MPIFNLIFKEIKTGVQNHHFWFSILMPGQFLLWISTMYFWSHAEEVLKVEKAQALE